MASLQSAPLIDTCAQWWPWYLALVLLLLVFPRLPQQKDHKHAVGLVSANMLKAQSHQTPEEWLEVLCSSTR